MFGKNVAIVGGVFAAACVPLIPVLLEYRRVHEYFGLRRPIWEIEKFSPQMWDPFRDWISATYPEDFDAMYNGGGTNFRLSEESIRLWEEHTREYVGELAAS